MGMVLDGSRFTDGRSQSSDANLHQRLVVVIGQKVGLSDDLLDRRKNVRQVVDDVGVFQAKQVPCLKVSSKTLKTIVTVILSLCHLVISELTKTVESPQMSLHKPIFDWSFIATTIMKT